MDPRFAVLRHLKALQNRDIKDAADWLADDVLFHSSVKTLNKNETLDLFDSIFDAFPDWDIAYGDLIIENDLVQVPLHMKGTHTNTLMLAIPGMKPIAATSNSVVLPKQIFRYRVMDDKIIEVLPEPKPESGLFAILKQIGAKLPPAWWLRFTWRSKTVKESVV
jgi:predicted ester cyclase